jgi:GTP-binding protein EngB required for normal cell division/uncharacterized protein (DUF697 family)
MRRPTLPARLLLLLALALVTAAAAFMLLMAADTALSVWERLLRAPWPFAAAIGLLLAVLLMLSGRVAWWLLRSPRKPTTRAAPPPSREQVEARIAALTQHGGQPANAARELQTLDQRAAEGQLQVALFGEINAGKSSLLKALAPDAEAAIDVIGGSTDRARRHPARLPDGSEIVLWDLPGLDRAGGEAEAEAARAEALRSHVVVYVCDGDLGRREREELEALAALDKPLVVALNKRDRYRSDELDALAQRLGALPGVDRVVEIQSGGEERVLVRAADGSEAWQTRARGARIEPLVCAIRELAQTGIETLERRREAAVLTVVDRRLAAEEDALRARRAEEEVRTYTRRAVIGALAAVAPGTDLVIQGALASALLRALGRVYGVPIKELDADAFLARAGGTVRTTTSITLAIAGNALKAFPGLGTVAGGLVHALAYGLIFDALGRAVAETLAEQRRFDAGRAAESFERTLRAPGTGRLQALARLAVEEFRGRGGRSTD